MLQKLNSEFLKKCKNTISPRNKKDKNILLILYQQKQKNITPLTLFTTTCEKLAPGAALLPMVRAGRVSYIPGKIRNSSAIYKSLKWVIEEVKTPKREKFPLRVSQELKNVFQNTGGAISQKRIYIKEIRQARLNYRRRYVWHKFITKKVWPDEKKSNGLKPSSNGIYMFSVSFSSNTIKCSSKLRRLDVIEQKLILFFSKMNKTVRTSAQTSCIIMFLAYYFI